MDRDDLIDWYLEQKAKDINTFEELEYETDKLVKARVHCRLMQHVGLCMDLQPG